MSRFLAVITIIMASAGVLPAHADEPPKNVVLINAFTVPAEVIDEAIVMWETARDFLKTQPGYISTRLHRSISPDAKHLLINVAQWESPEAYRAATSLMRERNILPRIEGVIPGPGLYKVIRE